ncbi:diguanylate cyclase [Stutzerimonas tarimensis]|uniref:Diguanylate cyclase DosC n=1 Tax=Stutzerimonas tarimensis TaxID=1507735 RepID=A0ABV7T5F9_9GAMM
MQSFPTEQLIAEWQGLVERYPMDVASALRDIAQDFASDLATQFYDEMLADPASASFLHHDQVRSGLHRSMSGWIATLFAARTLADVQELIELQHRVGHVHARIEIPVSLVLRGARCLKERLAIQVQESFPPATWREASGLANGLVDLAIEIMCHAFSQSHDRNSRAEEAYRLFSVSQNVGAEKERQRAALLDWENQLMFALASGDSADELPSLASSEFGLWFRHKASHAFQGSPECASILKSIEDIDLGLPLMGVSGPYRTAEDSLHLLRQVREATKSIKFLLDSLFEQACDLDAGRDVLTRLLNRKFLPVVLGKEVLHCRQSGHSFAVLMIDVDHFKPINDTHGHEAGDMVLQQLAGLLLCNTRGGDYAFRLGGEEFLLILVDIDPAKALATAEKLRQLISREPFRIPQGELHLTVSIGLAVHDGHPDYKPLLQRADRALYQAKHGGRNRCEVAL